MNFFTSKFIQICDTNIRAISIGTKTWPASFEYLEREFIFRRGYAKRETTISMGQNMQMCHSLRCKQIDMSTANDLKSILPNNAGGTCTCNRVKTGLKTEGTQCDYDH